MPPGQEPEGATGWRPLPAPALGTAPRPVPSSSGDVSQMGQRCCFKVAPGPQILGWCPPVLPHRAAQPLVSPHHHPHLHVPHGTRSPAPLITSLPPPTASEGPGKAPSRAYWPPAPGQAQEGAGFRRRNCVSPRPAGGGDPPSTTWLHSTGQCQTPGPGQPGDGELSSVSGTV